MKSISTFISKFKAACVAATMVVVGIGASVPMPVTAATASSDASHRALQFAEDFGGYLDRANDGAGMSEAKTAKEVFTFCEKDANVSGEDWKFGVTVGNYYMDFMSGVVETGGYASGAAIDVFVNNTSLFTVQRFDDRISFGFDNYLNLSEVTCTTTPFILTGQVSWGVETVCSADVAMACAVYDFIVAEDAATHSAVTDPVTPDTIDGLYDFICNGDIANDFENLRNEANNGIANGWKDFSNAKSMIPNSCGVATWQSGLWKVTVSGQKLTNTGLEQGFVTATYVPTGSLLRFSFSNDGSIVVSKKKGGLYTGDEYMTSTIESPKRYGVIDFVNGDKIDSELIALAAVVDKYCSDAPRG